METTPLEYHPLFATVDEIEFYFLRNFSLGDIGRTLIIREMTVNLLRVWRSVLKTYALKPKKKFDAFEYTRIGGHNIVIKNN